MVKKIKLDSKHSVELSGSAGWFLIYRANFGRDILPDIIPMINAITGIMITTLQNAGSMEVSDIIGAIDGDVINDAFLAMAGFEITTLLQITWAMAKNADDNMEPFESWAGTIERFPVDIVAPELFNIFMDTMVSTKNSRRLRSLLKKEKPSGSKPSSQEQSQEDSALKA